ncbi:MAG: RDD family protein [Microthrixaceae bacterium]
MPGGPPGGGFGGPAVPPAEPGKRLIARLIDFGILVAVWIVVWIVMFAVVFADAVNSTSTVDDLNLGANVSSFVISLALWVLYWLYESLMASSRGQTIGKMIMGLRITDANGNLLTTSAAMKRSAVWLVPIVPCCIGFVGFLVIEIWGLVNMFNRPDRLTLMDQFAESTVTYA